MIPYWSFHELKVKSFQLNAVSSLRSQMSGYFSGPYASTIGQDTESPDAAVLLRADWDNIKLS